MKTLFFSSNILLIYFLTSFSSVSLFAVQVESEEHVIQQAIDLFDQNNYTGCINLIISEIKKDSSKANSLELQSYLGRAYRENREFTKSISVFTHIETPNVLDRQSKILLFNNFETLSEIYTLDIKRDSAIYWHNRAESLLEDESDKHLLALRNYFKARLIFSHDQNSADSLLLRAAEGFDENDNRILDLYTYLYLSDLVNKNVESDFGLTHIRKAQEVQKERFPNDTIRSIITNQLNAYRTYTKSEFVKSAKIYEQEIRPVLFAKHSENANRYQFLQSEFYRLALITYTKIGDFQKRIEYGKSFLELAPAFFAPGHFRYGEVYRDLASNYFQVGRISTYLDFNDKAINIFEPIGRYPKYTLMYKAESAFYRGNYEKVIPFWDEYISNYGRLGYTSQLKKLAYMKLYSLYKLNRTNEIVQFSNFLISVLKNNFGVQFKDLSTYYLSHIGALEEAKYLIENDIRAVSRQDSLKFDSLDMQLNKLYNYVLPRYLEEDVDYLDLNVVEIFDLYAINQVRKNRLDSVEFYLTMAEEMNRKY